MIPLHLPVKRDLTQVFIVSLVVALLMAVIALVSLFFQSAVYPTEELRRSFISNDVVNLLIGLPILLGAMALAKRGRLIGLLFWPGALYYITYNYLAYTIAIPFNWTVVLYVALIALSIYSIVRLLASVDTAVVRQRLQGAVSERFSGGVLAGFGILFFVMQVSKIVQGLNGQTVLSGADLALAVTDLIVTPTWVAGGILLWRRRPLGYLTGAGLLFQASMLFIGLLVFFLLQPLVARVPFPAADFVVVLVMGLICFVPFGLFLRGIILKERSYDRIHQNASMYN